MLVHTTNAYTKRVNYARLMQEASNKNARKLLFMHKNSLTSKDIIEYSILASQKLTPFKLTRTDEKLLHILANGDKDIDPTFNPSIKLISTQIGMSERSVNRSLNKLEELEILSRLRRIKTSHGHINDYKVTNKFLLILATANEKAAQIKNKEDYERIKHCGKVVDVFSTDYGFDDKNFWQYEERISEGVTTKCRPNITKHIKNKDNIITVDRTSNVEIESLQKKSMSDVKNCTPVYTNDNQTISVDKKLCDTVIKEESIDLESNKLNKVNTKSCTKYNQNTDMPVRKLTGLFQGNTSLPEIMKNERGELRKNLPEKLSLVEIFTPNEENKKLALDLGRDLNYIINKIICYYEQHQFMPTNPQDILTTWILTEWQPAHYLPDTFRPDQKNTTYAQKIGLNEIELNQKISEFREKNKNTKVKNWQEWFYGYLKNYETFRNCNSKVDSTNTKHRGKQIINETRSIVQEDGRSEDYFDGAEKHKTACPILAKTHYEIAMRSLGRRVLRS